MSEGDDDVMASGANPFTSPAGPDRGLLGYARNPTPVAGSGGTSGGLSGVSSHADIKDLDPRFTSRVQALQAAAKEAGVSTSILSGYRSRDLQQRLYLNYQAHKAGQPLPYPAEGSGGIAAAPGMSYHNAGLAVDMYASDPKQQKWLVDNAPKYGLYPGANFGDPGHFQMAREDVGGGSHGPLPATANASMGAPAAQGQTDGTPSGGGGTGAAAADGAAGGGGDGGMGGKLMTLAALQGLFPQHQFTPVDYNPYAYLPKVGGAT